MADKLTGERRLYKKQISMLLDIFAKTAIGEIPKRVTIPSKETDLTPLFVGVQLLLNTVREQTSALEKANRNLEHKIRELEISRRRAATLLTKVREDREKIRLHQIRSDAVIRSIGEGVVIADNKSRIVHASMTAKSILKITDKRVTGMKTSELWQFQNLSGNRLQNKERPINWVLRNRKRISQRYIIVTNSDTRVPVSITASPLMEKGKMIGTVEVIRDISREFELDRMKDEFVSITSHELRTPLTAIRGFITMANAGKLGSFPERFRMPLYHMTAATDRLIRLVNNLLDIQGIESGAIKFEDKPFVLTEAIAKSVDPMMVLIRQKKLRLDAGKIDRMELHGDEDRFVQVIQNLLSNAVKYSQKGVIRLSFERSDQAVICFVTDTGPGIPINKQHILFQKFGRVKHTDASGTGTGLGLYISRMFARKMGGDVWLVRSKAGKGSTFAFSVPTKSYQSRENVTI